MTLINAIIAVQIIEIPIAPTSQLIIMRRPSDTTSPILKRTPPSAGMTHNIGIGTALAIAKINKTIL